MPNIKPENREVQIENPVCNKIFAGIIPLKRPKINEYFQVFFIILKKIGFKSLSHFTQLTLFKGLIFNAK
jgi:hypothetical protein